MRNIFDWQEPPGVSIEQSFKVTTGFNGHPAWSTLFTAVCGRCGHRTEARAQRSFALDEMDEHACTGDVEAVAS